MNREPQVEEPDESEEYRDYAVSEQRRTLFRVLATNLVRELRSSGHHGSDLVGFVSQLMQAVTDEGFADNSGGRLRAARMFADSAHGHGGDCSERTWMTGPRVALRPPTEADQDAFHRWKTDPLVKASFAPALLDHLLHPGSEEGTDRVDLVVCDRESTYAFGAVSLFNVERDIGQAEIAKTIGDPQFRGKGLAAEAMLLVLAHGFDTLGLNRIYLQTLGGNLANIKLNEGIGFRFEGVLRQAIRIDERPLDVVLMALLRNEFNEMRSRGDEGGGTSSIDRAG